jgi:hypothetical protein
MPIGDPAKFVFFISAPFSSGGSTFAALKARRPTSSGKQSQAQLRFVFGCLMLFAQPDLSFEPFHYFGHRSQERMIARFGMKVRPRHFQQGEDPEARFALPVMFDSHCGGSDLDKPFEFLELGIEYFPPNGAGIQATISQYHLHNLSTMVLQSQIIRVSE